MKRRDLIRRREQMGCILSRNGGRHDWYTNPQTKRSQPVAPDGHDWVATESDMRVSRIQGVDEIERVGGG